MAMVDHEGGARNMNSIYGMIRAQKLARKIKARAVFLVAEKRKLENKGSTTICHIDCPQMDYSLRPFATQSSLGVPPRYLNSSSRSPFTNPSSRLTSASQPPAPRVNLDLYRMEPRRCFSEPEVRNIIKELLEKSLEGKLYRSEFCKMIAKSLSESIKEKVKALNYHRYKIISFVHIGQVCNQGIKIASLSLNDSNFDSHAEYHYKGFDFFAVGVVYGFYME